MPPAVRVRYETIEFGGEDIHLRTLRDKQQYEDVDGEAESHGISSASWSLFGVVWESSKALANLMFEYDVGDRRVLEVGCGIALSSLILSRRGITVTASDQHPEAGRYLEENCALNGESIPFVRIGWDETTELMGQYDLIIGSDLLYEPNHAELLADFIDRVGEATCEVVLADPGRGNLNAHERAMAPFGFVATSLEEHAPIDPAIRFVRYLR